ncbi:N-acetylmuramic acid 6-phosphate etherase [Lacticaseibacillus hegangensis]|uniref:N-acetylmuramic acid 6-phosphate etherase n=1 Tax=Lacticaseibacillus hegangensis TaxID=2486010 RepID=A0ABW4CY26_9LACO|nr:N-acetylmuramic acid 6-phosphate etherase [Lacticaseibacillus hegangensis]
MNVTEQRNSKTMHIDEQSTLQILKTINTADQEVPNALAEPHLLTTLAQMVDSIVNVFHNQGRLFYIGAGTSGRLGVLDASECVPTFGVEPSMVQGVIAGGERAVTEPVEGAEDSTTQGPLDLKERQFSAKDFLVGIAASGRTPYVIAALKYARKLGSKTGSISCNPHSEISQYADFPIEAVVGPEILTGSTRMKAGTAQKLLLNMISTTAMIRLGKTYSNLMVDLKPTNTKLNDRAQRIISEATGVSSERAHKFYLASEKQPKVAIVMIMCDVSRDVALKLLDHSSGHIADSIELAKKPRLNS